MSLGELILDLQADDAMGRGALADDASAPSSCSRAAKTAPTCASSSP